MNNTELLIELYSKCLEHNYTDINDETQKLKIKVIAMDLGIKYKKIENLYSEARTAYIQHQKVIEEYAKRDAEKALKEARRIEAEKTAKLILTVTSTNKEVIRVFKCDDGSVFFNKDKERRNYYDFCFKIKSGSLLSYTYHPSKTYFTGASVGGVIMGGFHETDAYYTANQHKTDKGEIILFHSDCNFTLESVVIEPEIGKLFKRVSSYNRHFSSNKTTCRYKSSNSMLWQAAINTTDFAKQMELTGVALDEEKLPYSSCVQIANILNSIIKNDLPIQDEEIYQNALKLADSIELEVLTEAVKQFEYIKDYKDSQEHLDRIKPIYEDLLQKKKEQLVLEKEVAVKKKRFRNITISASLIVVVIACAMGFYITNMNQKYTTAKSLLGNAQYKEAITAFTELGNYKDSTELLEETKYQYALTYLASNEHSDILEAEELLITLKNYKDSQGKLLLAQAKKALSNPSEYQTDPNHAIFTVFCDHMYQNFLNAKSIIENYNNPIPEDVKILYDQINFALSYYGTWNITSGAKAILFTNPDKYKYVNDIDTEKIHIALLFDNSGIGVYFLPIFKDEPDKVFTSGCMFNLSNGLLTCTNENQNICTISEIANNEISLNEYSNGAVSRTLKLIKTANTFA